MSARIAALRARYPRAHVEQIGYVREVQAAAEARRRSRAERMQRWIKQRDDVDRVALALLLPTILMLVGGFLALAFGVLPVAR